MVYQAPPYDEGQARRTLALIAATCFLFAAVWAYVFYTQKPRVADGAIDAITVVPLHTELRQGGTVDGKTTEGGYGGGLQKQDELYVWVALRMKNLTDTQPLFATGERASLAMMDGTQQFAYAESPAEVAKVRALPGVQQVPGVLVPRELTLAPGKSADGLALFAFPVTWETWDRRREFSVAVSFKYQRDLALKEPKKEP